MPSAIVPRVPPSAYELVSEFGRSGLVGQFLLDRTGDAAPSGWTTLRHGDWHLAHHDSLPVHRVIGLSGEPIGWLLGHAVDAGGSLVEGDVRADCDAPDDGRWEPWLYAMGGRFAAIALEGGCPRFYHDPSGSIAAVYQPSRRRVASTTAVIPYEPDSAENAELVAAMGLPESNAMYPVGLTPRHGIERLLPNHYLDLETWSPVRHWPVHGLEADPDVDAACARIEEITRRIMGAFAARGPIQIPLTAGQDSRMLLSCARPFRDRCAFYTVGLSDRAAREDVDTARRLARAFDLDHHVFPHREATPVEVRRWNWKIGCETGEYRGMMMSGTRSDVDRTRPEMMGNIAELSRAFYWRPADGPDTAIEPERLATAVFAPHRPEVLEKIRTWLDGVPPMDRRTLLDLYYLEQRMGAWGSLLLYSDAHEGACRVFPLNHRETIESILRLPFAFRREGLLMRAIIQRAWPELLRIPINEPLGLLRFQFFCEDVGIFLKKLLRAVREPKWAIGRARAIIRARLGRNG